MSEARPRLKKKICLLGAFGVGKTSLVRQFVHSIFDERYLSTIGVKIDRKEVRVGEAEVVLMIWDLAGEEEFYQVPESYFSGTSGYLLVMDGTRPKTSEIAMKLKRRIESVEGNLPFLVLVNKADLTGEWAMPRSVLDLLTEQGIPWLATSARTGENVEKAFLELASCLL